MEGDDLHLEREQRLSFTNNIHEAMTIAIPAEGYLEKHFLLSASTLLYLHSRFSIPKSMVLADLARHGGWLV